MNCRVGYTLGLGAGVDAIGRRSGFVRSHPSGSNVRIQRSFIQVTGVGEKTEQSLWEAGVSDWREGIDASCVGPTTSERLESFSKRATAELAERNISFFANGLPSGERWRLLESFRDHITALDIETTGLDPDRDVITTLTLHRTNETRTFVRDQDLTAERVADALADAGLLVTFNGSQFDIPFLEQSFDLGIDNPHVDLRYPCRRAGWSGGLKRIEQELGIDRHLPAVDGREAIRLWHRYRTGDAEALDRLIRYNREDTRTLLPIADRVVSTLDRQVVDPYLA